MQHYHTNLHPPGAGVDPHVPVPAPTDTEYYQDVHRCFGFHKDTGMGADCETAVQPRFSIKAGYYFSDVPDASFAPTWVVPGSHHRDGSEQLIRPEFGQPGTQKSRACVLTQAALTAAALLLQTELSRFSARQTVRSSSTDGCGTALHLTTATRRDTRRSLDMGTCIAAGYQNLIVTCVRLFPTLANARLVTVGSCRRRQCTWNPH